MVSGNVVETYKGLRTIIVSGNNVETITGTNTITYEGNSTETYKANRNMTINGNYKETVTGTYDLQVKSTASDALKITSVNGGISLDSGSSVGQEILINSHVKFNNILYYTPEILTSIGDTTTEGGGGAIGNKEKILSSNVLTILACDNGSINPAPTDPNWYCVVPDGTYNGQLKKVVLHPIWDSSSNGAVNIAINRFCDPDGSIYTSNYMIWCY